MKRIALVFPRFFHPSGDVPYGLALIAAHVRTHLEADVRIWDATFNPSHEALEAWLDQTRPDIVGISVSTVMFDDALRIATAARQRGAYVFAGGPHATMRPHSLLERDVIDAVVLGEGEETTLDLLRGLVGGQTGPVAGAIVKIDGQPVQGPPRPPIADLDGLPDPAWDLLPMQQYLDAFGQLDAHDPTLRGTGLIAARGCPYRCTFCQPTLDRIFGEKLRHRSPQRIIAEIRNLVEQWSIEGYWFFDDTFTVHKKWLLSFCDALGRSGLKLPWGCTTRANLIDEESMAAMAAVGCVKIGIGIESSTPRIVEGVYKKGIRLDDAEQTLARARRHNIRTLVFFMLGAPGETRQEILNTVDYAAGLDADEATFSIFVPIPGTAIHDEMVAQGYALSPNYGDYEYYSKQPFDGLVPLAELRRIQRRAFLKFYTRPRRLGNVARAAATRKGLSSIMRKLGRIL